MMRDLNNNNKFDAILEDLLYHSFSVIGLQETKITEVRASSQFKDLASRNKTASTFKDYWNFHDSDRAAGVGIIIAPFISKFVQKVHRHSGRFIAVDLYLPSKKLKFINIYVPPTDSYINKGKDLITFIIDHIRIAESQGFQCIIIGDFNVDPFKYHQLLEQGSSIPRYYQLVAFLTDNNYIDQSPKDISGKDFATFVSSTTNLPTSRIDLLWYPDSMIRNTFCFDQVWTLPSTKFSTDSSAKLDHRCIIGFFKKHLLLGQLPIHRVKQKKEHRTVFNFKKCTTEHWDAFKSQVEDQLLTTSNLELVNTSPISSTLPVKRINLNSRWQIFKDTVMQAAKASLPRKKLINNSHDNTPEQLIVIRSHLSSLNKIFSFIIRVLYPKAVTPNTCFSVFENVWYGTRKKPGLKALLLDIIDYFHIHIIIDIENDIPGNVSNSTLPRFKRLQQKVAAI